MPDADLFHALRTGRADVVTDRIEKITTDGVRLRSGRVLPADVLVTATGLEMLAWADIDLTVDGVEVTPGETSVYRGALLSGVPNLAICVGYPNASWTLRADLTSRYVCRLLARLDAGHLAWAKPRRTGAAGTRPLLDLSSGYVQRAAHRLPRQGERDPWSMSTNYVIHLLRLRFGDPTREMEFGTRQSSRTCEVPPFSEAYPVTGVLRRTRPGRSAGGAPGMAGLGEAVSVCPWGSLDQRRQRSRFRDQQPE